MADFPSKVSTETSAPTFQNTQQGDNRLRGLATNVTAMMDMYFLRSIPAILMMVEMVIGLLHWALIASGPYWENPVYSWVLFVAVTLWLLTIILFFFILFSVHQRLPAVPWPMVVMGYHGIGTVLYLTAFISNAATVDDFFPSLFYEHLAAASFFGAVVTVAYGASTFFSYLDWKGANGANAATSTVPT